MSQPAFVAMAMKEQPDNPHLIYYEMYVHHDGNYEDLGRTLHDLMTLEPLTKHDHHDSPLEGSLMHSVQGVPLTGYERRKAIVLWLFQTSRSGWSDMNGNPYIPPVGKYDDLARDYTANHMVAYGVGENAEEPNSILMTPAQLNDLLSDYTRGYTFHFDDATETVTLTSYHVANHVKQSNYVIAQESWDATGYNTRIIKYKPVDNED